MAALTPTRESLSEADILCEQEVRVGSRCALKGCGWRTTPMAELFVSRTVELRLPLLTRRIKHVARCPILLQYPTYRNTHWN